MTDMLPPADSPSYPSGPAWVPPVPVTVAPKRSRSFLVALTVGGGLVILGTFMPWATVTSVFGTITRTGIETSDGIMMLALGGVLIAIGFSANSRRDVSKGLRIVGILAATLMGLVAIGELTDAQAKIGAVATNAYAHAAVGGGLYLIVIGASVAFLGALGAGWDKPGDPS